MNSERRWTSGVEIEVVRYANPDVVECGLTDINLCEVPKEGQRDEETSGSDV